jgi:sugar diacid utilization regulator
MLTPCNESAPGVGAKALGSDVAWLSTYDAQRGEYEVLVADGALSQTSTLLQYLDSNQNAKITAQRLQIHVNTVRQRLATIEDLLGHWGNASRALEIHIALSLWSLSSSTA